MILPDSRKKASNALEELAGEMKEEKVKVLLQKKPGRPRKESKKRLFNKKRKAGQIPAQVPKKKKPVNLFSFFKKLS